MSLAAFNFGFDTSLFSSVQGMPSFAKEFGEYNEATKKYALPSYLSSVMNSTPFVGKLIGTLCTGPLMKRFGRKPAVFLVAVVSIIGVILQITSHSAAQYTVGRILCYLGTGVTISVVPTYQSETTPAEIRGATVASLQLWISVGQIIAAVTTNATKSRLGRDAWLIPTGVQFIIPAIMLAGYYFIPESPRYLIWQNRREEAFKALRYVRPRHISDEDLNYELDLIVLAEETQDMDAKWKDLFKGPNLRRTLISIGAMFGQQITGQSFGSQYQVVFLQQQGIESPSPFIMTIVSTVLNLVGCLFSSLVIDTLGRRHVLAFGGSFMAIFLYILGALGTVLKHRPLVESEKGLMLSGLPLFGFFYALSWGPLAYVIMGEAAPHQLREKTVLLSTSISVLTTFVVSFTLPYLLNAPYANLGAQVGYIYGSTCVIMIVWMFFFVPEMKNRSLEELDEMFANELPTRQFRNYQCTGIGAEIAKAEEGELSEDRKGVIEQIEVVTK